MGQRFHPDIYRQTGTYSEAGGKRNARFISTAFNSILARLRYVHVPILLAVLRFRGRDAATAEVLMRPTLLKLGFLDRLPNGDTAIMCIGHFRKLPADGRNFDARISQILSRKMQRLSRCGVDACCLIAFAHLWSDECQNEADIISLAHLRGEKMIEIR